MAERLAVQSRLLTITRLGRGPPPKSRNGSTCRLICSTQSATVAGSLSCALGSLLRIADQPGGSTDERERPVPGVLEAPQREDLHEVAEVQARRVGSKPQ